MKEQLSSALGLILGLSLLAALLPWALTPGAAARAGLSAPAAPAKDEPTGANPAASAANWIFECIDCPRQFDNMSNRSLRVDGAGRPHLAYGKDGLYHVYYDGATWHYETADASENVGQYAALALDAGGYAHIAYRDETSLGLKYAYQDAAGWHSETVYAGSTWGQKSIALDGAGHPWISYKDDEGLKVAYKDSGGWHVESVESGSVGVDSSLALGGSGTPHIAYTTSALRHAYRDAGGVWHSEIVDSSTTNWWTAKPSLALNAAGKAFISYTESSKYDLRYAYQDATGWHTVTVDSTGQVGFDSSLALDEAGHAHISYREGDWAGGTEGNLRYAYQDASGWHIETVDTQGDTGYCTSLALDGGGHVHVTYKEIWGDLKYAYRDASGWHLQTADRYGDVGGSPSLVIDASGFPHVSYQDKQNDSLKYAWKAGDGWHAFTVESGLPDEKDSPSSLALDGNGFAHITFWTVLAGKDVLRYARQNASGWSIETAASDAGPFHSLALDGSGVAHIAYHDSANRDLKYAYRDGSGWHPETVDSQGYVGTFPSLALDKNGRPHISYYHWDNEDLKYAYKDGTIWHIETVDSAGDVGEHDSLALDDSGYPRISYYDWDWGGLKYAYQDASGWHIEQAAGLGAPEFTTTFLRLGRSGYAHIGSSHPYKTAEVYYIYQDASGWHDETVISGAGDFNALDLDSNDVPYIAFRYRPTADLKLAIRVPDHSADLGITKTDNLAVVDPGSSHTYTIVVTNYGPDAALGATVTDDLPAVLAGATWTCAASGGSSCASPGGSGDIQATVDLAVDGTATFIVTSTLASQAIGSLVNTASVAAPAGLPDLNPVNNSATDTTRIASENDVFLPLVLRS